MTPFAIYSETGEILRTGLCQPERAAMQVGVGERWVITDGTVRDDTHYISDMNLGLWALKGARPSERHDFDYTLKTWVERPRDMPVEIAKKVEELNAACRAAIVGGFTSSALGSPHVYDAELEDQTNLLGTVQKAVLTGAPQPYRCLDPATGIKDFLPHTPPQLQQLLDDGAARKLRCLQQVSALKLQAAAAATYEALQVIVWSDPDA